MVDLAKIRKKAKKEKREEPAAAPVAAEPTVPPSPSPAVPEGQKPASTAAVPGPVDDAPPPAEAAPPLAGSGSKLEKFKQRAGQRREQTVESEQASVAEDGRFELLTFAIADEQYAVDIERIVEIVTPRPVTRIPNSDPSVVGILSLRGTIVTLVDVRRKLGHRAAPSAGPDTRIVVVDNGHETVGFSVDRVLRVVKAQAAEIEPHPVVHSEELDDSVRGVFRPAGALTILLDLDKLLDQNALA